MDRLVALTASVVIDPVADIRRDNPSLIHSIRRDVITLSPNDSLVWIACLQEAHGV
jgi:hypothetical protein